MSEVPLHVARPVVQNVCHQDFGVGGRPGGRMASGSGFMVLGYFAGAALEQVWRTLDSHGQIMALGFR